MVSVMKRFVVLTGLASVFAAAVLGQPSAYVNGYVPFEFGAGKSVLPAGTYRFSVKPSAPTLSISGKDGVVMVGIITRLGGASPVQGNSLVFDDAAGRKVLSEVWIPGAGGFLVSATSGEHKHVTVIASGGASSPGASGKAIFEQTCVRCHGPGGKGNPAADKFFQKDLPRLNSDYVQSKSDAELKEIITQGRRKMEPVGAGSPTILHLLPPESVDKVISYVRTLKKAGA